MHLDLQILHNKQISVHCCMDLCQSTFCFALLDSLKIKVFLNNGMPVATVKSEPCRFPFRPQMTKYTIFDLKLGTLTFDYTGPLHGFFLVAEDDLNHFSFYNAWYPVGFDADSDFNVTLRHDDSKTLLNGIYDATNNCWHYQADHQLFSDCNILLYNPLSCAAIQNEWGRMLFFNPRYQAMSAVFSHRYAAIAQFYKGLYGYSPKYERTIVFLPANQNAPGAYIRDGLIVFGETYPDERRVLHILAHELGHVYACGADTESWEDWLNETHAEWSALLYALDTAPDLFDCLIAELQERYAQRAVALHPADNSRPQDVHSAGAWLYYGIYQQYGRGAIEMLLRIFSQMEVKTTAYFISSVAQQSKEIADVLLRASDINVL